MTKEYKSIIADIGAYSKELHALIQIGRASCRERVCLYV